MLEFPSAATRAHRRAARGLARVLIFAAACAAALPALAPAESPGADVFAADFEPPSLAVPANGERSLRILSPTVLEITAIVAGAENSPPDGPFPPPPTPTLAAADFSVSIDGAQAEVREVGFRRRVVYAPLKKRDLRIGNFIYLQLDRAIGENKSASVSYRGRVPWLASLRVAAKADPLRLSPAIHVNQVGYAPDAAKSAFVGYYLGTLGELAPAEPAQFFVVDVRSGKTVHRGTLAPRPDRGMPQPWYRKVTEANFSELRAPGEYRLVVPGYGASYPFFIDEGTPTAFARAYALGLYHQRCGTANALPFTRFVHDACHTAPVEVPSGPVRAIKGFEEAEPGAELFAYVRKGKFDAAGGHHDAGDYSKYTTNSAALIHLLVFAADSLAGVAALDNLGLPESGDGKSDVLQIAKWEADFLAKLQDEDGGFYFLVYPRDRRYEDDVLPDHGDPQIVWPKNTTATAAATAALAQCASSPKFREYYPDAAKRYLAIARRGWEFLTAAEKEHGRGHTYRKFTHYGALFDDADEIAWAACELFLATGERTFERELLARFDPRDPATRQWGWRRLSEGYGNAIRSYAFAARSGRMERAKLDRTMLARCEDEIIACADDWVKAARDSAYGTSYPEPSKRVMAAGWYFSTDQAFDLAVAAQLEFPPKADKRPAYRDALYSNLSYDAGANPVSVCFITGLGWKRPLEVVNQYGQNDRRVLPPSGIPIGSIQDGFTWFSVYKGELGAMSYPPDGAKTLAYPILDRWGDSFNLHTEFVSVNLARALGASAWLMAQSPLRGQKWQSQAAEIQGMPGHAKLGESVRLTLKAPGLDLSRARIVWEGRDNPPVFAREFAFTPRATGEQWVEAEAQWPDGRRMFAVAKFSAR
jgi:hypothetical protein